MRALTFGVIAAVALLTPRAASGQFSHPCELACITTLGATGFVAATGASVAVGRATGGMTSVNQGLLVWGGSFAAIVGGGMALSGNGERQERAVYATAIGTAAGTLVGLTFEAIRTDGDEPHLLAGTLVGAALGAVAGGIYGAVTWDEGDPASSVPLLSVSLRF